MRILICEDCVLTQQSLKRFLEALGHTCEVYSTAEEVVQRCETGEGPDLIISDLNMLGMDGLELAERLQPRAIPFVLMSATVIPKDLQLIDMAEQSGLIKAALRKPFGIEDIEAALDAASS